MSQRAARVARMGALIFSLLWILPAGAATFNVNSTTDAVDSNIGNGTCATSGGVCTLRAAVQEANALAGADTINLPAGTYLLTRAGTGEDAASTGDLDITQALTINGASATTSIINGNDIDRVFHIPGSASLTLSGLTVTNGNVSGEGGGIYNTSGTLTLTDVAITSHVSSGKGGGIYNQNGSVTLTAVTISGNSPSSDGGGIYNDNSSSLNLTNVTLSGNSTNGSGGAINNSNGTVTLTNVTIASNSASSNGGGIHRNAGIVTLKNTIVANSTSGGNCSGGVTSAGNNLDSANTCGFAAAGDLINTNPNLGALANNGGQTQTRALLAGSPAIDAGTNIGCPIDDQRGFIRPVNLICDIGAYEFGAPGVEISGTVFEDVNYGGGSGRSLAASSGVVRPNARVELYNAAGLFFRSVVTNVSGVYTFASLPSQENYTVRVVSSSVTSSRPGFVAGLLPVQTFRTDASSGTAVDDVNRVGGENPTLVDAGNGSTTLAALTTATTTAQSITPVTTGITNLTAINFGFNFDTIVSTRNSGQGSLRQFITNSNTLTNAGLAQAGLTAGRETSIFMISDGAAHPGMRAGIPNQFAGGTATITTASALPTITDGNTAIDGTRQTAATGNSNPPSATSTGPEITINLAGGGAIETTAANTLFDSIGVTNNTTTGQTGAGILFTGSGVTGSIFRNSTSWANTNAGVLLRTGATNVTITNNILRNNGTTVGNAIDGVTIEGADSITISNNQIFDNGGYGIDFLTGPNTNNVITGNTIRNNGFSTGNQDAGIGLRLATNTTVGNNTITANQGDGIIVNTGTGNLITQNSIFANGELGIDLGGAEQGNGVTLNDAGDVDSGANNLLNYSVIETATLSGGNLTLTGFARPGSIIEFFIAAADPSGFGEGQTYLVTLTEGSGADADATTGTYGPGLVNGIAQGTDTTNRFSFTISVPPGVAIGTVLTATATLSNSTSEFSGNATVAAPAGVAVSGTVYRDLQPNGTRDGGESGTGQTLYVKRIPRTGSTCNGPATDAVAADTSTGAYSITGVATGVYCLVIDDNNSLADITPTAPSGWVFSGPVDGLRQISVAASDLSLQDFGLYEGARLTGSVFEDTGLGGGAANDGVRNGTEGGIAGAAVRLTDATGATTYGTVQTDATGAYTLYIPASLPSGTTLRLVETNLTGYLSTGGQVGTTGGSYARATDTTTFTLTSGASYTGVNFADVPVNQFNTDGLQSALPGTTLYYPHTFSASSAGEVSFASSAIATPSLPGWSEVFHRDADCDGQFDAGEPQITAPIPLSVDDSVCILVKEFVPAAAPLGAQNVVTVTASFTYTNASPALATTHTRTDTTTVGDAALRLQKAVDKAQALPGEVLTYTITYTNTSSRPLTSLIITDATPVFSTFDTASCGTPPAGLVCTPPAAPASAPLPGGTGPIIWGFSGSLLPGASSSVQFTVRVDS